MMFAAIIIACLGLAINGLPAENPDVRLLKDENPELQGGGFEGDMHFPPDFDPSRGVGINGAARRWPSKIIPYDISAITNVNDRNQITNAMNILMFAVGTPIAGSTQRTACVFFRPAQAADKEVLKIQYGNGCSASVGFTPNYQKKLTLQQNGCFQDGIIQHELTHVLGFFHEQSRPDRDTYITVHHENIQSNQEHNFQKFTWGQDVESQGSQYDYGSLMHYTADSFSKNGKPTITPKQSNVPIGKRVKLSGIDISEIRNYYKC
jgi:hypothetical protein